MWKILLYYVFYIISSSFPQFGITFWNFDFFPKKRLSPAIDFCLRTKILHFPSQISSPLYIECKNKLHSINLLTEANIVDTSNTKIENVLKWPEFEKVRGPRSGGTFSKENFMPSPMVHVSLRSDMYFIPKSHFESTHFLPREPLVEFTPCRLLPSEDLEKFSNFFQKFANGLKWPKMTGNGLKRL